MRITKLLVSAVLALALVVSAGCQLLSIDFPPNTSSPPASTMPSSASAQKILEVTFLDVGQAASTVIQYDDKAMIIDAGTNSVANTALPLRIPV